MDRKQHNEMCNKYDIPIWAKMNLTINEAAAYSNIGIHALRNELNKPSCPFLLNVGNKRLIKRVEFEKWNSKCKCVL